MNIAYFRNSSFAAQETVDRLKKAAADGGFSVLGEAPLPGGKATVVTICQPDWARTIVEADPNLMGLLPCSVTVLEKGGVVMVGAGTPTLLAQVAQSEEMAIMVKSAEAALRGLVETAAGVQPLKPQKLKLYSSHTCPYCMMEKKWLDEKNVAYELIYVDDDQEAAVDLVRRTGQRGVPITEVIYDDDEVDFIVGFDRGKLEGVVAAM